MKRLTTLLSAISSLVLVSSYSLNNSASTAEDATSSKVEERMVDFNTERNSYFGNLYIPAMYSYDAVRAGLELRSDLQPAIQERVWSSPIWVTPTEL